MSVQNETARIQYTLTSTGQTLSVPFYFLNQEDIRVIRQVTGEPPQPLTLNTDYSVSGAGNEEGGEITMVTGNAGDKITIRRDISITQLLDYVYNDRFPAQSHERGLDRLTMITQMLADDLERTLRFPETDLFNTELSASRKGFVLSFGDDGALSFNLRAADVSNLLLNGAAKNFPSRLTYTVDTAEDPSEGGSLDNLRDLQKGDLNIVDRIPIQVSTRGQILAGDNPDGVGENFALFYGKKFGNFRILSGAAPSGFPAPTEGVIRCIDTPWTDAPLLHPVAIQFNSEEADEGIVTSLGLEVDKTYYLKRREQLGVEGAGTLYLVDSIEKGVDDRFLFPNVGNPPFADPPLPIETVAEAYVDDGSRVLKAHASWDSVTGADDAFWVATSRVGQRSSVNVESIVAEADGGSAINAVELTPRDLGFGNAAAITNYLNNVGPITVNAGSYYGDGEGGGGLFNLVNDASLVPDDGLVFAAAGIGSGWRLRRIITEPQIIYSERFGFDAEADGSTNDSEKLLAALAILEAQGGGELRFGPGSYRFGSSEFVELKSNITISGSGVDLTNLTFAGGMGVARAVGEHRENITIKDATINMGSNINFGYALDFYLDENTGHTDMDRTYYPGSFFAEADDHVGGQRIHNIKLERLKIASTNDNFSVQFLGVFGCVIDQVEINNGFQLLWLSRYNKDFVVREYRGIRGRRAGVAIKRFNMRIRFEDFYLYGNKWNTSLDSDGDFDLYGWDNRDVTIRNGYIDSGVEEIGTGRIDQGGGQGPRSCPMRVTGSDTVVIENVTGVIRHSAGGRGKHVQWRYLSETDGSTPVDLSAHPLYPNIPDYYRLEEPDLPYNSVSNQWRVECGSVSIKDFNVTYKSPVSSPDMDLSGSLLRIVGVLDLSIQNINIEFDKDLTAVGAVGSTCRFDAFGSNDSWDIRNLKFLGYDKNRIPISGVNQRGAGTIKISNSRLVCSDGRVFTMDPGGSGIVVARNTEFLGDITDDGGFRIFTGSSFKAYNCYVSGNSVFEGEDLELIDSVLEQIVEMIDPDESLGSIFALSIAASSKRSLIKNSKIVGIRPVNFAGGRSTVEGSILIGYRFSRNSGGDIVPVAASTAGPGGSAARRYVRTTATRVQPDDAELGEDWFDHVTNETPIALTDSLGPFFGTATILEGNTTLVLAHGRAYTPSIARCQITPQNAAARASQFGIASVDATNITIEIDSAAPSGGAIFSVSIQPEN
jgi:hypothetical protein